MKNMILLSILFLVGMTMQAQEAQQPADEPLNEQVITEGYYDLAGKQLVILGPAAEALWNQMKDIQEKDTMKGLEVTGRHKESNGTYCERSMRRPRPLARSVAFYACQISQNSVGAKP